MTTTIAPTSVRRPPRRRRTGEALAGWGFVTPATLLVVGLSIFPAVWAFLLSLQDWNGFSTPEPVGADNYLSLIHI